MDLQAFAPVLEANKIYDPTRSGSVPMDREHGRNNRQTVAMVFEAVRI